MIQKPEKASYLLAIFAGMLVLHYHLLPAVIAGLAVHVITIKLAQRVPGNWGSMAREVILGLIAVCVVVVLFGIGFGLWSFLIGHHGMADLLAAVTETLGNLKRTLPASLALSLPDTVEEIQSNLVDLMRENGRHLSQVGMEGVKIFAHVLLGMVIGGMTALHSFKGVETWPALSAALHARLKGLSESFYKVVFAQAKISTLNTILTTIYLAVILPLCGVHLPMVTVLIIFTFVAGLLPVVGNLISNAVIVVISLGVSPAVGGSSLVFLVLIHKLEYFTNAKIVGGEVHARAWELLCAMLLMEAIFGIGGMVAAPIVYAWLKAELKNLDLV
ncbi:MAG: AI-2E family transporter [Desulfuromonadales bacterium]|nr:AI-2E family transporter [Desulfuromonadales bacterium]